MADQAIGYQSGIPASHDLASQSPFVDSGVSLDMLANKTLSMSWTSTEIDDDVFLISGNDQEKKQCSKSTPDDTQLISSASTDSSSSNTSVVTTTTTGAKISNTLNRSRRTNFSKKETDSDVTLDDGEYNIK